MHVAIYYVRTIIITTMTIVRFLYANNIQQHLCSGFKEYCRQHRKFRDDYSPWWCMLGKIWKVQQYNLRQLRLAKSYLSCGWCENWNNITWIQQTSWLTSHFPAIRIVAVHAPDDFVDRYAACASLWLPTIQHTDQLNCGDASDLDFMNIIKCLIQLLVAVFACRTQ